MVGLMEGKIKPGDVVVVRYEGPKGSPGGRKVTTPMHSIVGLGITDSVALVTDGAFSGTNLGAGIGYVSPEAASGGPIAIVRDGDEIEIDVEGRRIDLLIPEEELNKRLAEWQAPPPKETKGVLGLFARSASSYPTGAYVF
jgi:dihydroxy-acid dehydratase